MMIAPSRCTAVERHSGRILGLVACALLGFAGSALADPVDGSSGTFSTAVPIAVPRYRGLEPSLALSYNSAGGNGVAGVGWTLTGASVIERAAPGKGAPRYDGADIFLLDGQELVAGCTVLGGTHCTRTQSYLRISYDGAAKRWTIWAKDGTKSVFDPIFYTTKGIFRWGLASVQDTRGNAVTYSYWCATRASWTAPGTYSWTVPPGVTSANAVVVGGGGGGANPSPYGGGSGGYYSSATLSGLAAHQAKTVVVGAGGTTGLPGGAGANSVIGSITATGGQGGSATAGGAGGTPNGSAGTLPLGGTNGSGYGAGGRGSLFGSPATAGGSGYVWVGAGTGNECYLDTVTYGGTTVKAYYATRSDAVTYATGASPMATMSFRLKTIEVKVGADRARAYKLTYGTSPSTQRSILSGVQQYGTDATLDSSGTVTGGTALPATTLSWQSGGEGAFTYGAWLQQGAYVGYLPVLGDFNGDGKTDILWHYNYQVANGGAASGGYRSLWLSNGDGTFSYGAWLQQGAYIGYYPYVGDFNGDGCDDLLWSYTSGQDNGAAGTGGYRNVWTSNCDGTFGYGAWLQQGAYVGYSPFLGDFNGDGKTDILWHYNYQVANGSAASGGYRSLWLSNGDGTFSYGANLLPGSYVGYFPSIGDFNGDGCADLLWSYTYGEANGANAAGGFRSIWLSSCDGTFTYQPNLMPGTYAGYTPLLGDFNGDGKTDILWHYNYQVVNGGAASGGSRQVWLSQGDGSFSFGPMLQSGAYVGYFPSIGDFNGDGCADLLWSYTYGQDNGASAGGGYRNVWYSKCDADFTPGAWLQQGAYVGYTPYVADFTGDGVADMMWHYNYQVANEASAAGGYRNLWIASVHSGDLISQVTSPSGGTMALTYRPSSAYANTNGPPLVQTVATLALGDGRGGSATTAYTYSGGTWDAAQRRFLGFRYQQATEPCITGEAQCPYTETWFRQDSGSAGKPDVVHQRDGAGTLLAATVHEYTTNGGTVPHTSLATGQWAYAYDGTGAACPNPWPKGTTCAVGKRTYVSRTFDAYANPLVEVSHGDYDVLGDEKTTARVYVPRNTSTDYLVGLPAVSRLFDGETTGGTLLEEALVLYDGNASWNAMPTQGLPTKTQRLASTTPSYQEVSQEYDSYGNLTAEYGPQGQKTAYLYDATYHLYRTEVRDPLYHGDGQTPADPRHKVTMTPDPRLGLTTQLVGLNGLTTSWQYDALGRLTRLSDSAGYFEHHAYVGVGSPTAQYVEVQTPPADGSGNLWRRSYVDGLGREYKLVAKGPTSPTQDIVVETQYNARGAAWKRSAPYAASGETAVWVTTAYDALDRATRTTNPDGTFVSVAYGLGVVTVTDEVGRQAAERRDGLNRVVRRSQWRGAEELATLYEHNARGQATTITDPRGNVYRVTYDALGRRASYVDPDRGTTTYEHDAAGRLAAVVNALGRTEYTYDLLGRKLTQVEKKPDGTVERSIAWAYDEARAGYANVGTLTSMTDPLGSATLDYDAKGHLVHAVRVLDGQTYTYGHGYDAGGRLLWSTLPDGDPVGTPAQPRTYDGAGRPKTVPGYVTAATYHAHGRLATLTHANGVTTSYAYDAGRKWLTDIDTVKGATVIQDLRYDYDAGGRRTRVTSPFTAEGWTYGYDALGYLTSATNTTSGGDSQAFAYDVTGNLTSATQPGGAVWSYTYNAPHGAGAVRPHAVTAAGNNTYAYDAMGNMVSGAGRAITWGVNGLPRSVNGEAFGYDGNGARVKKTAGATTTYYVGGDYEVTGGVVTKYVSFATELVAKKVGAAVYHLHTDVLGSVQAVTDASGVEVQRFKYRPFGERLSSATGHAETRRFTGARQDESGLIYLNARYYDPVLARFVSADPAIPSADLIGLNRYAYAGNDPVNHLDTNGLGLFSVFKKLFKKVKKLVKKVIHFAAKAVKSLWNTVKAAVHGDWKAIVSIGIMVATIYFGGQVLSKAVGGALERQGLASLWVTPEAGLGAGPVLGGPLGAYLGGGWMSAYEAVVASGLNAAVTATAIGVSAGISAASSLAMGLVQTGSLSAAFKSAVSGLISGAINAGLNLTICAALGLKPQTGKEGWMSMGWDGRPTYITAGGAGSGLFGFHEKVGYYNSVVGQLMAKLVHDPFANWLYESLNPMGTRPAAITFLVANVSTALVFNAAAEGGALGVIAEAFGKDGPTTSATFAQTTAAATFFDLPRQPFPGVTREDIARDVIRVAF